MENLKIPMADGAATLSGRDYEFQEPTLRRESTVKRESRRRTDGDREEFRLEEKDDESKRIFELTKKLGKNFLFRHHIEPTSSTCAPREESLLISKICIVERDATEKEKTFQGEDWRGASTSEAKTN